MAEEGGWLYRVTYPRSKRDYDGPKSHMSFTDYEEALGFVEYLNIWVHGAPVTFEKRQILYTDWEEVK